MQAIAIRRTPRLARQWQGSWAPQSARDAACIDTLQPALRLLLTTDGTVTPLLALLAGESVAVRMLAQRATVLADGDDELALWSDGRVLERRVLLHGAQTGTPLLYGASRIVPHRLPRPAREQLAAGGVAIGLVMREHRIETLRVPLSVGIAPATDAAAEHLGAGLMCHRRYAINADCRPLMIVDEQFPATGFGTGR